MQLVFDLDECLVSTREANRAAYTEVGVTLPPEFDYLPVALWPLGTHPDPAKRARKHEIFERHLRERGEWLPTADLLMATERAIILTGTSERSVRTIVRVFPQLAEYHIQFGMGPGDKIRWLLNNRSGVYFDDWPQMVRRVREETAWQAIDVSGF